MATTVAHGLIGIAVYCGVCLAHRETSKLPLNLFAFGFAGVMANIPDLDMIVSFILYKDHRVLHGAFSHSLLFALLFTALLLMLSKTWERSCDWSTQLSKQVFVVIFFLVVSHVLVDWLTGPLVGFHASHGTPIFWPLIELPIEAPVTLFGGVNHSNILPAGLILAVQEFAILSIPIGLLVFFTIQYRKRVFFKESESCRRKS